ncbi:hypothetical protein ANN_26844 [Periplaneta americana]|uniref:Uncharacterized protein n=1 Tax=Periplaneta americana TaxID=6978 RepID=A0ABQ8RZE4_PERAM|nr:hypothetical protein ANN_26844 [Periplaneta americana]
MEMKQAVSGGAIYRLSYTSPSSDGVCYEDHFVPLEFLELSQIGVIYMQVTPVHVQNGPLPQQYTPNNDIQHTNWIVVNGSLQIIKAFELQTDNNALSYCLSGTKRTGPLPRYWSTYSKMCIVLSDYCLDMEFRYLIRYVSIACDYDYMDRKVEFEEGKVNIRLKELKRKQVTKKLKMKKPKNEKERRKFEVNFQEKATKLEFTSENKVIDTELVQKLYTNYSRRNGSQTVALLYKYSTSHRELKPGYCMDVVHDDDDDDYDDKDDDM